MIVLFVDTIHPWCQQELQYSFMVQESPKASDEKLFESSAKYLCFEKPCARVPFSYDILCKQSFACLNRAIEWLCAIPAPREAPELKFLEFL